MGYNLKETYCDLAYLEGASRIATVSAIFGKDILEGQKAKEGNLVDLNLGSLGDFREGLTRGFKDRKAPLMEPFSAGSSKRARAPSSAGLRVSCLVDGCRSDLSKCREYHRRHKVCEMHSKTPKVTIEGHEQRFCQQCSRFHSLGEFDEGKRSCRKRLEGHNRRRRKPQPEPLPVTHGNFLCVRQGGSYFPFSSNQPMISAGSYPSVVSTNWSGAPKAGSYPSVFSSSVCGSYSQPSRSRQFPFLESTDPPLSGASSARQVLHHNPSSPAGIGQKMLSNNGLNQVIGSDHRALSLLSSSVAETPEMGLGRIIQPNPINPGRQNMSSLLYSSIVQFPGCQGMEGSEPGFVSNMRNSNSNSLCEDVLESGTDASSATANATHHQTLSFSWE